MTGTTPVHSSALTQKKGLQKSIVAGSIGVLVHWFDWAVYAYMATTIAAIFFPESDRTAGLLATFAVFAVSFLVRPLGAILFGRLGDKLGRKLTLSVVILSMAVSTLVLGILPTYQTIGVLAPILLILTRIVQGLAAGGEFGSAAAFLGEFSPRNRRGFGCSWLEFGSLLGFLLASFAVYLLNVALTPEQITEWGWRIPFLITVPLGFVGLYIRRKIEDTPEFEALQKMETVAQSPLREVFKRNPKEFIQTCGMEIFMNVTFYVVLVYLLTYQETSLGFDAGRAALLSTLASALGLIIVPLAGIASDRWGRKPVLMTAAVALTVLSVPLFMLMGVRSDWAAFASTFGLAFILAIILGTHAATVVELFPTRTRQTGLSIAYAITAALFAGTAPYALTWLIDRTGSTLSPGFFLAVVGVIGIVTVASIPETRGVDLLKDSDKLTDTDDPATHHTESTAAEAKTPSATD
ncbi:MFS transporter [Brevibacterium casei]|uniref:Putative proline/betaine transporter n=2 Tax=Brevibacterium casei TaxID=33889 RepID=A0A2H1JE32_9MICO|nr:MFS transporter [Brevibacterium casei]MCT1552175.1 MFS transporter [Brevibacterium casei]MCT1559400.1 MFS transporter [Brevibacterium casei]MCT2207387.1 MFS transporter [Brevibacterium casei]PAK97375.1 MFS transporter [Brevibacterium casei]QPR39037.1 MFS transporter [Brevibacterium casei]